MDSHCLIRKQYRPELHKFQEDYQRVGSIELNEIYLQASIYFHSVQPGEPLD